MVWSIRSMENGWRKRLTAPGITENGVLLYLEEDKSNQFSDMLLVGVANSRRLVFEYFWN